MRSAFSKSRLLRPELLLLPGAYNIGVILKVEYAVIVDIAEYCLTSGGEAPAVAYSGGAVIVEFVNSPVVGLPQLKGLIDRPTGVAGAEHSLLDQFSTVGSEEDNVAACPLDAFSLLPAKLKILGANLGGAVPPS